MNAHPNDPALPDTDAGRRVSLARPTLPLDALPPGRQARVARIEGSGPVAKRLMEMGIVPGAPVSVVRAAPLGDPIEVRIRSYHLALRRSEARTILVMSDE